MKHSKWVLLIVPLLLISGSLFVARKRAQKKRVLLLQIEFKRALDDRDPERMKHLLSLGANPDVDDSSGWSALDYAVGSFDDTEDLDEALLRAHANVNRRNAHGEPPLAGVINVCGGCGCTTNDEEAIFLLQHGAKAETSYGKRTPLLDSADMVGFAPEENLRLIPVLLRYGADANKRNLKGETAYDIVAAFKGDNAKQEKQRQHVLALLKAAMKSPKHHLG